MISFSILLIACTSAPPARLTVVVPTDAGPAQESRPAETWWEPTPSDWSEWTLSACLRGEALPSRSRSGGTFAVVEVTRDALRWRGEELLRLDSGQLRDADRKAMLIQDLYDQVADSASTRRFQHAQLPCLSISPDGVLYSRTADVPIATERAILYTLGQATAEVHWLATAPDNASPTRTWTLDEAVPLTMSPYPAIGPVGAADGSPLDPETLRRMWRRIPVERETASTSNRREHIPGATPAPTPPLQSRPANQP